MYDHAELAAFLFYTAYLAIQVTFDYHCIRCFSVIPGSRSACYSMLPGCRVIFVTLGPRGIFSVLFVSTARYSLLLKYIYFSMIYQSIARLLFLSTYPTAAWLFTFFLASAGFLTFLFWPLTVAWTTCRLPIAIS
jgi:hypothetical protein